MAVNASANDSAICGACGGSGLIHEAYHVRVLERQCPACDGQGLRGGRAAPSCRRARRAGSSAGAAAVYRAELARVRSELEDSSSSCSGCCCSSEEARAALQALAAALAAHVSVLESQ